MHCMELVKTASGSVKRHEESNIISFKSVLQLFSDHDAKYYLQQQGILFFVEFEMRT
jgi:hypothetical protein